MALLGSVEAAKALIRSAGTTTFSEDEDARLLALHKLVTAAIERETGRTWGEEPTAETRVITAPGVSPVLVLPEPVRSVSLVVAGGVWDGAEYQNGQTVDVTEWRLTHRLDTGEYLALTAVGGGYWSGPVAVTGVWQGANATPVPDDITYVANLMMAHWFRVEKAGPTGFQGPDGATVPVRRILSDERVKPVLEHYKVQPVVVV